MSSKAELNQRNQHLEAQIKYAAVRFNEVMAKNRKLNKRLARRRNGLFRRLWVRTRALLRGN